MGIRNKVSFHSLTAKTLKIRKKIYSEKLIFLYENRSIIRYFSMKRILSNFEWYSPFSHSVFHRLYIYDEMYVIFNTFMNYLFVYKHWRSLNGYTLSENYQNGVKNWKGFLVFALYIFKLFDC